MNRYTRQKRNKKLGKSKTKKNKNIYAGGDKNYKCDFEKNAKEQIQKLEKQIQKFQEKNQKSFIPPIEKTITEITERIDRIRDYRQRFSSYWNHNPDFWKIQKNKHSISSKKNTNAIASNKLDNHGFSHPVIDEYLKYDNNLENALYIYCGNARIGIPEYKKYLEFVQTFKQANNNINITKLMNDFANNFYKNSNVLQPTNWQMFLLHVFIDTPIYLEVNDLLKNPNITKEDIWYNFLDLFDGRYRDPNSSDIFVDVFGLGSGHDADLEERADIIAERCKNNNIRNLITMDGHGRFLCSFLNKIDILKRNPSIFEDNDLSIYICDIDEETINWHDYLFPTNVSVSCNILSFIINSFIHGKINDDDLFYLNFSGLLNQSKDIIFIIQMFIDHELQDNILLSFSTVRGAKDPSTLLINELQDKGFQLLTDREDFVTMGTKPKSLYNYYSSNKKPNNSTNVHPPGSRYRYLGGTTKSKKRKLDSEPVHFQTPLLERWVGLRVKKYFEESKKYYEGTITKYDPKEKWFSIHYDDGEEEDLTFEETSTII